MIKEAINRILELSIGQRVTIDNRDYSTNRLFEIIPPTVKPFTIHTLTGIIDYFSSPEDVKKEETLLHIETPTTLALFGPYTDQWKQRDRFLDIELIKGNPFRFNYWYEHEQFVIEMQAKFIQDETTKLILSRVGNITDQHVKNIADDGISQDITVRKGITQEANTKVPNPVTLNPYRTFPEVEQPSSNFIFRLRSVDGGLPQCALFDADGGQWQLEAIQNIKEWLEEKLPEVAIIA